MIHIDGYSKKGAGCKYYREASCHPANIGAGHIYVCLLHTLQSNKNGDFPPVVNCNALSVKCESKIKTPNKNYMSLGTTTT